MVLSKEYVQNVSQDKDAFINPILFGVSGVTYFIGEGGKNALPLYFLN